MMALCQVIAVVVAAILIAPPAAADTITFTDIDRSVSTEGGLTGDAFGPTTIGSTAAGLFDETASGSALVTDGMVGDLTASGSGDQETSIGSSGVYGTGSASAFTSEYAGLGGGFARGESEMILLIWLDQAYAYSYDVSVSVSTDPANLNGVAEAWIEGNGVPGGTFSPFYVGTSGGTDSKSLTGALDAGVYTVRVRAYAEVGSFNGAEFSSVESSFNFSLLLEPVTPPVPEPSTLALMGSAVAALLVHRRRRKSLERHSRDARRSATAAR